jgi:hypothetical protein
MVYLELIVPVNTKSCRVRTHYSLDFIWAFSIATHRSDTPRVECGVDDISEDNLCNRLSVTSLRRAFAIAELLGLVLVRILL